jgi:hypothetical protein
MPNYANGKIYKLINSVDSQIYIGSTTQTLSKRKGGHKVSARKSVNQRVYAHLNSVGWDNVRIVLIEDVVCERKEQLCMREQHYIDLLRPSLNTINARDVDEDKRLRTKFRNLAKKNGW